MMILLSLVYIASYIIMLLVEDSEVDEKDSHRNINHDIYIIYLATISWRKNLARKLFSNNCLNTKSPFSSKYCTISQIILIPILRSEHPLPWLWWDNLANSSNLLLVKHTRFVNFESTSYQKENATEPDLFTKWYT